MTSPLEDNQGDGLWDALFPHDRPAPANQVEFVVGRWGGRWVGTGYGAAGVSSVSARSKLGLYVSARLNVGLRTPAVFHWPSKESA